MNTEDWGRLLLRYGLAALFLWFGTSQVMDTASWIAWVPEWASRLSGLSETNIVLINGSLETIGAILLGLGLWTRVVAFWLALHLLSLAVTIGYNDIGVRDFGLGCATLALAFFIPDRWTLDAALKKRVT